MIKMIVEAEVTIGAEDLAKHICDDWNDWQGQVLLKISEIVDSRTVNAQHQIYEIGRYVSETMTKDEKRKINKFVGMLKDLIVDFDEKESENNG